MHGPSRSVAAYEVSNLCDWRQRKIKVRAITSPHYWEHYRLTVTGWMFGPMCFFKEKSANSWHLPL